MLSSRNITNALTMIDFDHIDHVAYIFMTIKEGYNFFESQPGFRVCAGSGIDDSQGIRFIFVKVLGIGTIKIIAPASAVIESPITKRLSTLGPGLNHICYSVSDIESSVGALVSLEWEIVSDPISNVAFGGRKTAFLTHRSFGLIELLESKYLFSTISGLAQDVGNLEIDKGKVESLESREAIKQNPQIEVPLEIVELINSSLENKVVAGRICSFDDLEEWDSLSHAIFHSSFETILGHKLELSRFDSLDKYVRHYIDNH